MAFAHGVTLYGCAAFNPWFYTFSEVGGVVSTVTQRIVMPGFTVNSCRSVTARPTDNSLWAVISTTSGPGGRVLARISTSGAATAIGVISVFDLLCLFVVFSFLLSLSQIELVFLRLCGLEMAALCTLQPEMVARRQTLFLFSTLRQQQWLGLQC